MGLVTNGLDIISANMGGLKFPTAIGIGISGNTFDVSGTTLGSETDRNLITSTDLSSSAQVTFISNFSPIEISGTVLREFGTFTDAAGMIDRQVLTGSLVFDGEQELQIQETFKFFISGT